MIDEVNEKQRGGGNAMIVELIDKEEKCDNDECVERKAVSNTQCKEKGANKIVQVG